MVKKYFVKVILLTSILLIGGCTNLPGVKEAMNQANRGVSGKFEEIGLEQKMVIKPIEGQFRHKFDSPFNGTIYVLADKEQIENNIDNESFLINGKATESILENSKDDFNIKHNGRTYFSIKKIKVESISELELQTTVNSKFIVYLAK